MTQWSPVFVLPNLELAEAIEGEVAALAPAHDSRVRSLARAHRAFGRFIRRFSDVFGERLQPPVLIVRTDAPHSFFEVSALAGFRDLIAIAAITAGRAAALRHAGSHRVLFGNAFAFYPWMLDKTFEHLIATSPAILALHEVDRFRGQSSPELFRMMLVTGSVDAPLLEALLVRWRSRFRTANPSWGDIALLRSLNMAYHASLLPAASEVTFYDVGRLISLWVSAFEILVHPGGNGQANRDKVFELLERVHWLREDCAEKKYDTGGRLRVRRTLACWLYQRLYDVRNGFLHGNPVASEDLMVAVAGRTLLEYAAPLYRAALTAFLPLTFDQDAPASTAETLGALAAKRMAFRDPQRAMEDALLTAVRAPTGRGAPRGRRA